MSHRGLTEGEERRALREELDIHSYFSLGKLLGSNIKNFFIAVANDGGVEKEVDPNDYWKQLSNVQDSDGSLTLPSTLRRIQLISRAQYNWASFRTKLPNFSLNYQDAVFGLGTILPYGYFVGFDTFLFVATYYYNLFSGGEGTWASADITYPIDALTVRHQYKVVSLDSWVEFYVDGVLRGVWLRLQHQRYYYGYGVPAAEPLLPYRVGTLRKELPVSLPILIMMSQPTAYGQPGSADLVLPLAPGSLNFGVGDTHPPRVFMLYQRGTETLFAGSIVAAGSLQSQAVPVLSYEATLHFMAGTAGTLLIEYLSQTNNWRTYDSVAYAANNNWFYRIFGRLAIVRLTYTPSSYPATVAEAEVVLD